MNNNQRIGLGFLLLGLLMIPFFYFFTGKEGFVIAAIIGLMAMAFGGFQFLIAKPVHGQKDRHPKKRRRSRK
jgi:hypothetical protein